MKLFKISQDVNNEYDTYSEAIVCAENEEEAIKIHPNGEYDYPEGKKNPYLDEDDERFEKADEDYGSWSKKKHVKTEYIGEAKEDLKKGVVCASFHAG